MSAMAYAFGKAIPKIPQSYDHRNGETEMPTIQGWYWFRGRVDDWDESGLVKVNEPNDAFPTRIISPQWIYGWMKADSFIGQWWGPIVAPWDGAE